VSLVMDGPMSFAKRVPQQRALSAYELW